MTREDALKMVQVARKARINAEKVRDEKYNMWVKAYDAWAKVGKTEDEMNAALDVSTEAAQSVTNALDDVDQAILHEIACIKEDEEHE